MTLHDIRRQKGRAWESAGHLAYGNNTGKLDRVSVIEETHKDHNAEALDQSHKDTLYRVAGRVMLSRGQGKLKFINLRDVSGIIQLFISKAEVGDSAFDLIDQIDLGDIILVEGPPMRTKTGQLSIRVRTVRPLTKSLRSTAKYTDTQDVEVRYRQRYADLIEHEDVRDVFRARTLVIQALRSFLDQRGFMEVETPVLQPLRGGATARPFKTHHNALDMGLYLRIAPELYLKRLVVGGFERVYEVARTFRNEGISTRHNPEFTMLEYYQAYATYEDLMEQTEQMLAYVNNEILKVFPKFSEGRNFTLATPFRRVRMLDAVAHVVNTDEKYTAIRGTLLEQLTRGSWEQARDLLLALPYTREERTILQKVNARGELLFALYELLAEPRLTQDYRTEDGTKSVPVFITDYPFDVSPLARKKDIAVQKQQYGEQEITYTDRFELFLDGREICNAFSELNDPDDQASRFNAQLENRARGDEEAMDFDQDYVRALEYGMPPTAGFGLGVDRLVMFLTGAKSIRDVILFPLLRPET